MNKALNVTTKVLKIIESYPDKVLKNIPILKFTLKRISRRRLKSGAGNLFCL